METIYKKQEMKPNYRKNGMRKITLFAGQWIDLPLEDFLDTAKEIGFDGVDLVFRPDLLDLDRVIADDGYCENRRELLQQRQLSLNSVSAAYIGKCVGDIFDIRHNGLVPQKYRNKPEEIRRWAVEEMMKTPEAARKLGCSIVHSFLGSPIWNMFYAYPKRPQELVEEGFEKIATLWLPILNEFERQGVDLAFEVHPSEIAYDYYTLQKLLQALVGHPRFRINYDPSHLIWQGMDPVMFLRDFAERVVNVHIKDVKIRLDGRSSVLGSHLPFGDGRRGWNFRTPGHGDVPFEEIIRELNEISYKGALTVEWEDNGMHRDIGVREAYEFVKGMNFPYSEMAFDEVDRYGKG